MKTEAVNLHVVRKTCINRIAEAIGKGTVRGVNVRYLAEMVVANPELAAAVSEFVYGTDAPNAITEAAGVYAREVAMATFRIQRDLSDRPDDDAPEEPMGEEQVEPETLPHVQMI